MLLDVSLDDQEYTVDLLRSGHVLAAVTANAQPVQGVIARALGKMTYAAVASPSFIKRYFADGVTAAALARAPAITFNRIDRLQATVGSARMSAGCGYADALVAVDAVVY